MATGRLGLHINSKSIRPSPPFYPCTPPQYFVPAHQVDKARDPKLGSSVRLLEFLRIGKDFRLEDVNRGRSRRDGSLVLEECYIYLGGSQAYGRRRRQHDQIGLTMEVAGHQLIADDLIV